MSIKKLKYLTILPATILASFNSPAYATNSTETTIQQPQKKFNRVIISGSIPANTHYSIKDSNGKLITKGQADSNGIFISLTTTDTIKNSQSLELTFNHQTIIENISTRDRFITFAQVKKQQPLLLLGDYDDDTVQTANDVDKIIFRTAMGTTAAAEKVNGNYAKGIWQIIDGLFGIFFPAHPDSTAKKISNMQSIIGDIQDRVNIGFETTNQRFSDLFGSMIKKEVIDTILKGNQISAELATISNVLANADYKNFWNNHPEYRSIAKIDYDNLTDDDRKELWNKQQSLWQDLFLYDMEIDTLFSITEALEMTYDLVQFDSDYELTQQKNSVKKLYDAIDKLHAQKQLQDNLKGLNSSSINIDLTGMGDVCSGDKKNMAYLGFNNTLLNMSNIYILKSNLISFGFPMEYSNRDKLVTAYINEVSSLIDDGKTNINNCSFFDSNNASGWPNITYATVLKDNKPYLMVVAPLKDLYDKPDATDIAFRKNNTLREKHFSVEQNLFFDALLEKHWNETEQNNIGQKAAYTNTHDELIAYYALKNKSDIKNNELFDKFSNRTKFDLKATSSGGAIAQIRFKSPLHGEPKPVTISVNDEKNRNCAVRTYNNGTFITHGYGNMSIKFTPTPMAWASAHELVEYSCNGIATAEGTSGGITFTVSMDGAETNSITENIYIPGVKLSAYFAKKGYLIFHLNNQDLRGKELKYSINGSGSVVAFDSNGELTRGSKPDGITYLQKNTSVVLETRCSEGQNVSVTVDANGIKSSTTITC